MIKKLNFQKELGITNKKPRNKKGSLWWWCKPRIPILIQWSAVIRKHFNGVKIGICGLQYHHSDPLAFFSDPYFLFQFYTVYDPYWL